MVGTAPDGLFERAAKRVAGNDKLFGKIPYNFLIAYLIHRGK
jgi:hypothetical protein